MISMEEPHGLFMGGLLSFYSGMGMLYFSWPPSETTSMGSLRFRGLLSGSVCTLGGIWLMVSYFF